MIHISINFFKGSLIDFGKVAVIKPLKQLKVFKNKNESFLLSSFFLRVLRALRG